MKPRRLLVAAVIAASLATIAARAETRTVTAFYLASEGVGVWPADAPAGVGGVRLSIAPEETAIDITIDDLGVADVRGIYYLADVANQRPLGGGVFCGSIQDVILPPEADTVLVRPIVHALELPVVVRDGIPECAAIATAGTITIRFEI